MIDIALIRVRNQRTVIHEAGVGKEARITEAVAIDIRAVIANVTHAIPVCIRLIVRVVRAVVAAVDRSIAIRVRQARLALTILITSVAAFRVPVVALLACSWIYVVVSANRAGAAVCFTKHAALVEAARLIPTVLDGAARRATIPRDPVSVVALLSFGHYGVSAAREAAVSTVIGIVVATITVGLVPSIHGVIALFAT
jgi:hypothetical protein